VPRAAKCWNRTLIPRVCSSDEVALARGAETSRVLEVNMGTGPISRVGSGCLQVALFTGRVAVERYDSSID